MALKTLLLVVAATGVTSPLAADPKPAAKLSIDHTGPGWRKDGKPISVRVGNGAWRSVAPNQIIGPFDVAIPATGAAVAIDVQLAGDKRSIRRLAALVPGASYRVVGNPCAFWGLDVDARSADEAKVRFDASAIPANLFPLVISTTEDPTDQATSGTLLDRPGVSPPLDMPVSAMCSRSGTHFSVRSKPTKQVLFNDTLIPHPGRLHTIKLARSAPFELVVAKP